MIRGVYEVTSKEVYDETYRGETRREDCPRLELGWTIISFRSLGQVGRLRDKPAFLIFYLVKRVLNFFT